MKALEDLFTQEITELYDAERQIVKALPKMAKAAQLGELRKAFELHLKQTQQQAESAVVDAALITVAQKVEHYEIALYGSARSHAQTLGYTKVAGILEETLREEEATDALLTRLANRRVNAVAAKAPAASARVAPRGGDNGGGWGIGGVIAGAAIGAGIALLYAPKPGGKVRKELKARGEEWRTSAENLIERGKQLVNG